MFGEVIFEEKPVLYFCLLIGCCLNFGCTKPVHKPELLGNYSRQADDIATEFESRHPQLFNCFDLKEEISRDNLIETIKICIDSNSSKLSYIPTNSEVKTFSLDVKKCLYNVYLQENESKLNNRKIIEIDECRNFLFFYVMRNQHFASNNIIFEGYYNNIFGWYKQFRPDLFYCFKRNENDLSNDMNHSLTKARDSLFQYNKHDYQGLCILAGTSRNI